MNRAQHWVDPDDVRASIGDWYFKTHGLDL